MKTFTAALVFFLLILGSSPSSAQGSGYKVVDNVKIGGDGGWDYLNCDAAAHRLYISRGTHVQVFDTQSKTVIGDIPNTIGVHGIALAQEFGRGYTSNGRDSSVTVFDLATLKTTQSDQNASEQSRCNLLRSVFPSSLHFQREKLERNGNRCSNGFHRRVSCSRRKA